MNNYKKKISEQKGQVAVIIAILVVCLLGVTALVIDLGSLYQVRGSFQTVADSAALAGAQELPEDPNNAVQVAIDYAARHDVNITSGDIQILSTLSTYYDTIIVTPSNPDTPTYFAGVFGMDTVEVGAYAEAMVGRPIQIYNVVPWLPVIPEGTTWEEYLDPGTEKRPAGDRRGKSPAPGIHANAVSREARCPSTAACPNGVSPIYSGRNTAKSILIAWRK